MAFTLCGGGWGLHYLGKWADGMPSLEDAYKLARKNLEAKFIISLIAQLTSIWLAHTKQLDGALWVYFTLGNIAAYGAIETGQQIIAARTATKLAKGET